MAAKFITLELNDNCKEVKMAQDMLRKCGSTIQPTGKYTIGMVSAVKSFQKKNGLPATGRIDKKTWDKLVVMANTVKRKPKEKYPVEVRVAARKPAKK